MKTNLSPKIFLLTLTAAAALSFAHPAKATMFDVSGTCTPGTGFTGTTFSGTLTIDVTAGTVTAMDVSFQGLSAFTEIVFSSPKLGTSEWAIAADNPPQIAVLELLFNTGHTPASLVGFTGGSIVGNFVMSTLGTDYTITGGSLTPAAAVPDGGSTVSLLSFALIGLAALRRKLSC